MALTSEFIKEKFSKPQCFGICGVATAGKDTFFAVLRDYLKPYGVNIQRFALADKLKDEINPYLTSQFDISAWTTNPEEKKLIRPSLVAHGYVRRMQSKGTYWTKQIEQPLQEAMSKGVVPVVTDIRYAEYSEDEVYWITKFGGKLVYITRYENVMMHGGLNLNDNNQDGPMTRRFIQPPNEDERRNDPKLRAAASHIVEWDTVPNPTVEKLSEHIERFISTL